MKMLSSICKCPLSTQIRHSERRVPSCCRPPLGVHEGVSIPALINPDRAGLASLGTRHMKSFSCSQMRAREASSLIHLLFGSGSRADQLVKADSHRAIDECASSRNPGAVPPFTIGSVSELDSEQPHIRRREEVSRRANRGTFSLGIQSRSSKRKCPRLLARGISLQGVAVKLGSDKPTHQRPRLVQVPRNADWGSHVFACSSPDDGQTVAGAPD